MSRGPRLSHAEEREIMKLSEEEGWISAADIEAERAFWQEAAKRALDGERQRISISIPLRDLARLKTRVAEEGMPYQTLINAVLHKYVEG